MGESVVVTGASGQLGQYMIKYLQDNHPDLTIVAAVRHRSNEGQSYIFNTGIEFAQIDLCDSVSTDTLIDKYRPTYFINTAANAFVGDSWLQPRAHIEYNTIGVLNQLEAIRKFSPSTRYFNMGCHDTQTKVVTPNGIKDYKDLKVGDLLYTINETTAELELKPIKKIVEYDYTGDMFLFNRGRLCITPNHNVIYTQNNKSKIHRKQCRDFVNLSHGFYPINKPKSGKLLPEKFDLSEHIPVQSKKGNKNYGQHISEINTYDLMYLIGAYIGDGSSRVMGKKYVRKYKLAEGRSQDYINNQPECIVYTCPQVSIAIPENDECFQKFVAVLDRNGIRWGQSGINVTFHQWGLHYIFDQFGHKANEKNIPDWIFELDHKYLLKILEGIKDTDGDQHGRISTCSEKLSFDISKLMILCGTRPSLSSRKRDGSYSPKLQRFIKSNFPECRVYGHKNKRSGYRKSKYTKQQYNDKIWCFEMEDNHNFLVYRNGLFTFSGNTSEEFGCSTNDGRTQNESTIIGPKSPYGVSKAAARYMVNTYRDSYGLFAIQGWTFNFESPLRSPKYVTRKVTNGIARVLYSDDKGSVRLGNLDSYRSWQYAGDVADGVWKMITNGQPKPYVLSSNETHSIRQLVESSVYFTCGKIGAWEGKGLEEKYVLEGQDIVVIDPTYFRPNDVTYLNGDSSLIRSELGWDPKIDFNGLIKMMVKFDTNLYT